MRSAIARLLSSSGPVGAIGTGLVVDETWSRSLEAEYNADREAANELLRQMEAYRAEEELRREAERQQRHREWEEQRQKATERHEARKIRMVRYAEAVRGELGEKADWSIETLYLPTSRSYNGLRSLGVNTAADLVGLHRHEGDRAFLEMRNLGRKTLREIKNAVRSGWGIELDPDHPSGEKQSRKT